MTLSLGVCLCRAQILRRALGLSLVEWLWMTIWEIPANDYRNAGEEQMVADDGLWTVII